MITPNKKNLFMFCFLWILCIPVESLPQYSLSWAEYYERNAYSDDNPVSIASDNDGMIYVSGNSYGKEKKIVTLKYDTDGNLVWKSEFSTSGENDEISSMTLDCYSNIYLTGTSSGEDVLLIKYSSDGELLWFRTYDFAGDAGYKSVSDNFGFVYVLASCIDPITDYDICLLRFTPYGELLWARRYDGGLYQADIPADLAVDNNGDIVIAGSSDVRSGVSGTLKYHEKLFNKEDISSGEFEMCLIKYGPDGTKKWDMLFRNSKNSLLNVSAAVRTDRLNNILLCGTVFSETSGMDYCLAAFSPAGRIIYSGSYNSSLNNTDIAVSMLLAPNGSLLISGTSYSGLISGYFTLNVSPGGALNWSDVFNGNYGSRKEMKGMCSDSIGNVFITGTSGTSPDFSSFLTVSYNQTGRMTWYAEYSLAEGNICSGTSVASDIHGNVLVSGFSKDRERDFTTLKYSTVISVKEPENAFASRFSLKQNFPNPFNSSTIICFTIPEEAHVSINVYDISGRFLSEVLNDVRKPGSYETRFDASGLASGVYFYRIKARNTIQTKSMVLVK